MKVLILGIDGYLGWSLASYLADRGHVIAGIDNGGRRKWVDSMASISAIPIAGRPRRQAGFKRKFGYLPTWLEMDLVTESVKLEALLAGNPVDAIVHLAECPSAPFSMIDREHAHFVQLNNVMGTLNLLFSMQKHCPDAHLVKLGTMGEYGTPNVDIPEGYFDIEYRGRRAWLPFPKQAGSMYHLSKVHDTNNIAFACKMWGLRATDVMQGVVYGTKHDAMKGEDGMYDPRLWTRLDFDEAFGTAINRFVCQAIIGEPITVYAPGDQKRGFLPLKDSMECLSLAIENPADVGQHRVFNQFEYFYSINFLAQMVADVAADEFGLRPSIEVIDNPRIEAGEHYYNPDRVGLTELGYEPSPGGLAEEIRQMMDDLMNNYDNIENHKFVLKPKIKWDQSHR